MKTLQTILGSLALVSAVAVPVNQSNADTLDSLVDNKTRVELMQDKKEKTVAEKIFDFYKGKIFKVTDSRSYRDVDGKLDWTKSNAVYQFPDSLSGSIKLYQGNDAGFTSEGRIGLEMSSGEDEDSLWMEGFILYMKIPTAFKITLNSRNEQVIQCKYYIQSAEDWGDVKNSTITFEEFSKSEYEHVEKLKKSIIGRYEMKEFYHITDNKKVRGNVDLTKDHRVVTEKLLKFKSRDSETGEIKEHELYVDYKRHSPVEVEFNDKGEMIFSPSKYEKPFKTPYDFNMANNNFYYRTCMEMTAVVPKNNASIAKKYLDSSPYSDRIVPVFKLDGSMYLEMYRPIDESATHLFILEKAK